jgi:hypothetical protein
MTPDDIILQQKADKLRTLQGAWDLFLSVQDPKIKSNANAVAAMRRVFFTGATAYCHILGLLDEDATENNMKIMTALNEEIGVFRESEMDRYERFGRRPQ